MVGVEDRKKKTMAHRMCCEKVHGGNLNRGLISEKRSGLKIYTVLPFNVGDN